MAKEFRLMNYPYYNLVEVIATALVNLSRHKGYTVRTCYIVRTLCKWIPVMKFCGNNIRWEAFYRFDGGSDDTSWQEFGAKSSSKTWQSLKIDQWTLFQKVKSILLEPTER